MEVVQRHPGYHEWALPDVSCGGVPLTDTHKGPHGPTPTPADTSTGGGIIRAFQVVSFSTVQHKQKVTIIQQTSYCVDQQQLSVIHYNRMCMKLFKSSNIDLVKEYQSYFCCVMLSITVKNRSQNFFAKYDNSDNTFCHFL